MTAALKATLQRSDSIRKYLFSSSIFCWIGLSTLIGLLLSIPLIHGDLRAVDWGIRLTEESDWLQWWVEVADRSLFQGGPPGAQDPAYAAVVLALIGYFCALMPRWANKAVYIRFCAGYYLSCMVLFLVANRGMKAFFSRARPLDVLRGDQEYSSLWLIGSYGFSEAASKGSFTSGHTTTALFLLPLGIFLWHTSHRWVAGLVLVLAVCWGFLVGFGRVLKGSHYPGDVLWATITCLWICVLAAAWLFALERRSGPPATPGLWELRVGICSALGLLGLFAILIGLTQLIYAPAWYWPLIVASGTVIAWGCALRTAALVKK